MQIMSDLVARRWSRVSDIANAAEDFGVDGMMYYADHTNATLQVSIELAQLHSALLNLPVVRSKLYDATVPAEARIKLLYSLIGDADFTKVTKRLAERVCQALARQELEAFDNWPLVTRMKDLGLTIRERKMADGGRLIIAVDDLTRFSGHVDGFQYRECFAVRLGPNGERAGRDGDINALEWYKRWYSTGAGIEGYIAEDIERSEKK